MKSLLVACLLGAAFLAVSDASASPFQRLKQYGSITIPPEWAGTWSSTDSVYDCNGVLQSVSTSLDTLCAGVRFDFQSDSTISCSGSATATTFEEHCTGTGDAGPDCQYTLTLDAHGTRNGDSFFSVNVFQFQFSGTGPGCDQIPDQCTQTNSHSTRTGPAPAEYCATPVRSTTWGKVKSQYR